MGYFCQTTSNFHIKTVTVITFEIQQLSVHSFTAAKIILVEFIYTLWYFFLYKHTTMTTAGTVWACGTERNFNMWWGYRSNWATAAPGANTLLPAKGGRKQLPSRSKQKLFSVWRKLKSLCLGACWLCPNSKWNSQSNKNNKSNIIQLIKAVLAFRLIFY